MTGLVSIGDGEHQLRVLALYDAVGAEDPDEIEHVAPAILGTVELGPSDELAPGDRLRSTWFVVAEGQGHLIAGDDLVRLAVGDTVGAITTPLFARDDAVITALGHLSLLEMDGSIAPEPSRALRQKLPANG